MEQCGSEKLKTLLLPEFVIQCKNEKFLVFLLADTFKTIPCNIVLGNYELLQGWFPPRYIQFDAQVILSALTVEFMIAFLTCGPPDLHLTKCGCDQSLPHLQQHHHCLKQDHGSRVLLQYTTNLSGKLVGIYKLHISLITKQARTLSRITAAPEGQVAQGQDLWLHLRNQLLQLQGILHRKVHPPTVQQDLRELECTNLSYLCRRAPSHNHVTLTTPTTICYTVISTVISTTRLRESSG